MNKEFYKRSLQNYHQEQTNSSSVNIFYPTYLSTTQQLLIQQTMILQYSFRKSFLVSNPPLKSDEQPILQLLPPEIPPSSLVRTYSFSQLKQNESFKEQFNDSSIELPKNPKLLDQMELQIQELKNQLKKQKQKKLKIAQEQKLLHQNYQALLRTHKDKDKQENLKEEKRQLTKKVTTLQQEVSILKEQIASKAQQLITYESRSEQSRRLLQKLNQNINKKQSKLIKDKELITRELEQTKMLLEESRLNEQETQKQLKQTNQRINEIVQNRQRQLSHDFDGKIDQFSRDYELKMIEKDEQIKELSKKLSQTKAIHEAQLIQIKKSLDHEYSTRLSTQSLVEKLRQQITTKDQSVQRLILKNKELSSTVQNLQSKLYQTQTETSNLMQSQNSRIGKLQLQITNFQYEAKQNEHKITFLQDENERMNLLVNELKQDKKILNKQKEQLKIQINEKTLQTDSLRNKLEHIKQNEIKYSSIIQNYQKQQQRFYDQQARQTSTLTSLEIKLKANAIDIQKLNLRLSQKQEELNKALKDLDKYKKMYKKQYQTLEMYKHQTHLTKQKTQQMWKQLKAYYENQIALLEEKITHQQSLNSNDSRIKIRNLMTNQKARINSSRLTINRDTPKSIQKQDTINLAIKKKLHFNSNGPGQELKQNYWHGLNNDSVDQSDQQNTKN